MTFDFHRHHTFFVFLMISYHIGIKISDSYLIILLDLPLSSSHASVVSVFSRLSLGWPGELGLVALGPLTNLAIALLADPGLGARLSSLHIMGGNMEVRGIYIARKVAENGLTNEHNIAPCTQAIGNVTATAEFNFHADPEAAQASEGCH